jgi:SAM-dependent methyltransferase
LENIFFNRLRCPVCKKGKFFLSEKPANKATNGAVRCDSCGELFRIINGIYHFCRNRGSLSGIDYTQPDWVEKERAREREYEQKNGFNDEWLISLPFPNIETETTFQKKGGALGKNFFDVLDRLHLSGAEYIFDMAAGCCWTSKEFSKRGCKVVSTDIRTIKYHGLRSAEAYFEKEDITFERLCWAFGRIPFDDATFDIVFCQNAFQYVENLPNMMKEIHRVLKPFGRFVLAWTGMRALFKSKRWGPGYYLTEYLREVRKCGFSVAVFPPVSLFGDLGEFTARTHFGPAPAKLISFVFKRISGFSKLFHKLFFPLSILLGIPFNMIACREPIK